MQAIEYDAADMALRRILKETGEDMFDLKRTVEALRGAALKDPELLDAICHAFAGDRVEYISDHMECPAECDGVIDPPKAGK